jgi:hypothetical protein
VVSVSLFSVTISWVAVTDATGYRVDHGDGSIAEIVTLSDTTWSPPYMPGSSFTVTVTPLNDYGDGPAASAVYTMPYDTGGGGGGNGTGAPADAAPGDAAPGDAAPGSDGGDGGDAGDGGI